MKRFPSLVFLAVLLVPACGGDRILAGKNIVGAGGATGGTTAAVGDIGGHGGVLGLDAGAADGADGAASAVGGSPGTGARGAGGGLGGGRGEDAGQDRGLDSSIVEREVGTDAVARVDGGGPLSCNGALLPDGLAMAMTDKPAAATAVGDLNADGKLDMITRNVRGQTSVLLGRGDGSFGASMEYPPEREQRLARQASLALADLNGDGGLDLVVANPADGALGVLLGKGDGSFGGGVSYPTGEGAQAVAVGDLNGDGHLDLASANNTVNTVSVLLGEGDGTFADRANYPAGEQPQVVVIGDLNADGTADLVVGNPVAKVVNVLLGKGDGTFADRVVFPSGGNGSSETASAALGDVNGDGKMDLVLATRTSQGGQVNVLLGDGDGNFGASIDITGTTGPCSLLSLLDLDGDRTLDLVLEVDDVLSIWHGEGDGTFAPGIDFRTGTGEDATSGALGDFDGDGRPDLAVTFESQGFGWVRVLLGRGDGAFSTTPEYPIGGEAGMSALGDLDGDGVLDLATANGTASVLLGKGDGSFAPHRDFATTEASYAISLGDLNGDGRLDLVTATPSGDAVSVLLNQGEGLFVTKGDYATDKQPASLALGDLNGDGILDVVTANNDSNQPHWRSSMSVLLGTGDGSFAPHVDYPTGTISFAVALGDLNGDGKLDAVVGNFGGSSGPSAVSVLLGNGDGTFAEKVDYGTATSVMISLVLGDLNADGNLDAVWGDWSAAVEVLLGNGDGTFIVSGSHRIGEGASSLTLADPDLDGLLDLVATNDEGTVCLMTGNGDGTFANTVCYPAAASTLALGDLNGDGRLEVVATRKGAAFLIDLCQ